MKLPLSTRTKDTSRSALCATSNSAFQSVNFTRGRPACAPAATSALSMRCQPAASTASGSGSGPLLGSRVLQPGQHLLGHGVALGAVGRDGAARPALGPADGEHALALGNAAPRVADAGDDQIERRPASIAASAARLKTKRSAIGLLPGSLPAKPRRISRFLALRSRSGVGSPAGARDRRAPPDRPAPRRAPAGPSRPARCW